VPRELDALLPLPRYLAQLAPDEAAALEEVARPPAGLLTRVRAAQVVSRHRLVRQRIAVAAAVVVALALAVLVGRQTAPPPPRSFMRPRTTRAPGCGRRSTSRPAPRELR
jgi:hypothetical protein